MCGARGNTPRASNRSGERAGPETRRGLRPRRPPRVAAGLIRGRPRHRIASRGNAGSPSDGLTRPSAAQHSRVEEIAHGRKQAFVFSIKQLGHGGGDRGMRGCVQCIGRNSSRSTTMITIESMRVGAPPEDFDFGRTGHGGPGQWAVVADTTSPSGRAIEQSSTERTDYRFPLAIHRPLSARNVDVALRFKAVSGNVDRAGGIAVRLADPDNYYVVRANALEDNVRFSRVVKHRREQIEGSELKVSAQA